MTMPEMIGGRNRLYDATKFASPKRTETGLPGGISAQVDSRDDDDEHLAEFAGEDGAALATTEDHLAAIAASESRTAAQSGKSWSRVEALVEGVNRINMDNAYSMGPQQSPRNAIPLMFRHDFLTPKQQASDVVRTGSHDCPSQIVRHADGKVEKTYTDGSRCIVFHNGTKKDIFVDNVYVIRFVNGDVKRVLPNGEEIYYYASNDITHVSSPDGTQHYFFANKQNETHHPDGTKEIVFVDGTKKYVYPSGDEQSIFPDGTIQRIVNGVKTTIQS